MSDYHAEYYKRNKDVVKRRSVKALERNYALVLIAKDRPCADCGKRHPPVVMDFDHVYGKKKFNLSKYSCRSAKSVAEEIAKCEVVCANCHRLRTQARNDGVWPTR